MSAWQHKHLSTRATDDNFVMVDIDQLNSIGEYNKTMGGIDRVDQNISY